MSNPYNSPEMRSIWEYEQSKRTAQSQEPEIVVKFDMVSDFWTHGREAWQATVGDYDLDCTVGTGPTPLAAIVDLLDQLEG